MRPRSKPLSMNHCFIPSLLGCALAALLLGGAFGIDRALAQDRAASSAPAATVVGEKLRQLDEYTLVGSRSFLDGYHALVSENAINVVVEIPAGTNAKWEVRKEEGGDGDPLDVILIGSAVERGTVLGAWPVGVLRLLDGGEVDHKIVAIAADAPLEWGKALYLELVRGNYPGVLEILEIRFTSYKGPGALESQGYGDAAMAWDMIHSSMAAFEESK